MFHINEIYLSHVIDEVEGKSKGPNTLVEGALLSLSPVVLRRL